MHTHPNDRLTPLNRERLLRRHIDGGEPLASLAAQVGISLRTAYKWLARYRSGGHTSLADRRSVRRTQRRTLDLQQLQQAVDLLHQRCTLRRIAKAVGAPLSTVGRVMKACNRLQVEWNPPKVLMCDSSLKLLPVGNSGLCQVRQPLLPVPWCGACSCG